VHAWVYKRADSWLLKDDTESNAVMESGSEFHSVLAAKDFWNCIGELSNHMSVTFCDKLFFNGRPAAEKLRGPKLTVLHGLRTL